MTKFDFWLSVLSGLAQFALTVGAFALWGWLVWLGKASADGLVPVLSAFLAGAGIHLIKKAAGPADPQPEGETK